MTDKTQSMGQVQLAEHARTYVQIAIGIIHAFTTILPLSALHNDQDVTSLIEPLMEDFPKLNDSTRMQALQALSTLVSIPQGAKLAFTSKSLSYGFLALVLVDIRSTIPSLAELAESQAEIVTTTPNEQMFDSGVCEFESFLPTTVRLAACYDILKSFIEFLLHASDEPEDAQESTALNFAPDELLKLRESITEALFLTIEYLEDRYISNVSATRVFPTSGDRKQLAPTDPIFGSALPALYLWVQDAGDEALRGKAADLMDGLEKLSEGSMQDLKEILDAFRELDLRDTSPDEHEDDEDDIHI